MSFESHVPERIIRLAEVKNRTGLSRSTIYRRIESDGFPPPRNLGSRIVGWLESEVSVWIESRTAKNFNADAQQQLGDNA